MERGRRPRRGREGRCYVNKRNEGSQEEGREKLQTEKGGRVKKEGTRGHWKRKGSRKSKSCLSIKNCTAGRHQENAPGGGASACSPRAPVLVAEPGGPGRELSLYTGTLDGSRVQN